MARCDLIPEDEVCGHGRQRPYASMITLMWTLELKMTVLHSVDIYFMFLLTPAVFLLGFLLWFIAKGSKD